jgi:uncharacterized protein (DUF488 family)
MTDVLYSVGHSSHSVEEFLKLLRLQQIDVVADVRSHPASRFAPQFNSQPLQQYLQSQKVRYVFLGKELGGRPSDPQFYDPEGYVLYSEVAESPGFAEGIRRLQKGVRDFTVVMMCSEEDPCFCHRRLLVGRVMAAHGFEIVHLRGNGRAQPEADLVNEEARKSPPMLFPAPWRSAVPLRHRPLGTLEPEG